jgi:hypothetical protein
MWRARDDAGSGCGYAVMMVQVHELHYLLCAGAHQFLIFNEKSTFMGFCGPR